MLPQLENLARIAAVLSGTADEMRPPTGPDAPFRAFSDLRRERFVFAGASILPLLLDEGFDRPLRRTEDTDVVVSVLNDVEWNRLREALKAIGIREDARDTVPVRFRFEGLLVDFIPARMKSPRNFAEPWLSLGFDMAEPDELENGQPLLRLPATAWLAAKVAAFEQRGRRDVLMSKDLEDIATLLIGRRRLVEEIRISPGEIRAHIVAAFRDWQRDALVLDAMDGSVSTGADRLRIATFRDEIAGL
jgi:hypothetical protein